MIKILDEKTITPKTGMGILIWTKTFIVMRTWKFSISNTLISAPGMVFTSIVGDGGITGDLIQIFGSIEYNDN